MPFYWDSYFGKTRHLSTTEHGAYLLILGSMWVNGGRLRDDNALLAKITGLRLDRWLAMAPTIREFLHLEDGYLSQRRLQKERAYIEVKCAKQRELALRRWTPKLLINNDAPDALAMPLECLGNAPTPTPTPIKETISKDIVKKRAKRAQKTRMMLPDDWEPTAEDCDFARERGFTDIEIQNMLDKFCVHHRAKGTVMADWHAAWRTWVLNAIEYRARSQQQWRK